METRDIMTGTAEVKTDKVKVRVVYEFYDKNVLSATNDKTAAYRKAGTILELDKKRAKELIASKYVKAL